MSAVAVGALVRPIGDDLRNAFFRVAEITRNGWARCYCVAYSDGTRTTPEGRSHPKFRTRELAVVETLPCPPEVCQLHWRKIPERKNHERET